MNVFDIIIAASLLFGFTRGLMKGLFIEVASIVALVAGVYGAIHFSHFASYFLNRLTWKPEYIHVAEFAITFVIIILIITLIGKGLTKAADFVSLGIVNKIAGGVFGFLKIGLILSVIFTFFGKMNDKIPFLEAETLEKSLLYNPIKEVAPSLFPSLLKEEEVPVEGELPVEETV